VCPSTGVITKAVHKTSEEEKKEEEVKKTLEQHDSIVIQYKDLIRDQVTGLTLLSRRLKRVPCFLHLH
jgi:hypothetical protein